MEVPKIEQRTFEQLHVVDFVAVGEVKLECISESTVERTDALFATYVRQTMELADIPVLQGVEEPVFSQVRVQQRSVEKNIVSQERQAVGIVRSQTSEKCAEIVSHDRVRRRIAEQMGHSSLAGCGGACLHRMLAWSG